jgi:peptide deformylase
VAVLEILHYPDTRLAQRSTPVTDFGAGLRQRLRDLEDTMAVAPGCVGLAAPQLAWFERVALVDVSARAGTPGNGRLLLINPEIVERDGDAVGREGCLSVPDYTGNVARAVRIRLRAQDADGVWREYASEGYEARAIQHELDHLDGLLFLDRLVSRRELFRRKNYK